jgi:TRAP-type C4-dicarboxylate transport system permease small subunit
MLVQVVIVCYVVAGRYIFKKTPAWGEELSLLCMVWFSLLSASLAVRDNTHIRMSIVDAIFPKKVLKFIDRIFYLLNVAFSLFMIIEGTKLTLLTVRSIMPGIGISISWLYVSVPIAGLSLMLTLFGKVEDVL